MIGGGRRLRSVIAAVLICGAALLPGWLRADAAGNKPVVAVNPSTASIGQTVIVNGSGLPAHDIFQVQVCGQNARNGSADCATAATFTVQAQSNGAFAASVVVVTPPTPCPCVVAAFSVTSGLTITTPISVPGAPFSSSPVSTLQVPRSHVVVAKSELAGSTPIAAWFGFPTTRTLNLTLTNSGAAPATALQMIVDSGSSPVLNTHLAPVGQRQTRTYAIAVTIPALSVGNVNLNGSIFTGDGQKITFKVPLSIWPVGLLLAALVLIQIILLAVRNIMRRRYERNHPQRSLDPLAGAEPTVSSEPTEPMATV